MVCRASRSRRSLRGRAGLSLLDERWRAGASGLLLRLSARVVPRRQPAAAGSVVSRRQCRASSGTSIAAPTAHESRPPSPARRPAHPAVFVSVHRELGDRRHRRSRADDRVAADAGQRVLQLLPLNEMAPGQQSPVLGDQRDGDRSDLHPRCRTCRSSRRSAARRALPRESESRARTRARRAAGRLRHRSAARNTRADARPSSGSTRTSGAATPARARAVSRVRQRARPGGSRTTRCFARSTPAKASGRGPSGRSPAAARSAGDRSGAAGARRASRCSTSTCSGSPHAVAGRASGGRRAAAWRCSAICRSWSTATAPTSGRGSISSGSTCRSARRRMRSARPARTGACRSTGGT